MRTMLERRDLVLDYMRGVKNADWHTPEMAPELIDAVLQDSLVNDFDINESPYFGQVFFVRPQTRREWVASAALFCWAGKHLCSGGVVMYTMAGLFSFPILPEAWHIEFQHGRGMHDRVTVCRLIPD